jgi:hypothetical protein
MRSFTGIFLLLVFFSGLLPERAIAVASSFEHQLVPDRADFKKFLGQIEGLEPPETIRVRITGDWPCDVRAPYALTTVDFNTYVKNVLPNEWPYWWPEESLRAGAVAVKMFAWYWIERGGKWHDADMTDNTCDQWYRYGSSHPRTDKAVDDTWTWVLSREGSLFETRHKNTANCKPPTCIKQPESAELARQGYRWDEILEYFYPGSHLQAVMNSPAGFKLRFNGTNNGQTGHVLLPLYNERGHPWVNVGAVDFTLEWFMKAYAGENSSQSLSCGDNQNWIYGSVIFDRDRPTAGSKKFGVSLSGGRILFGASGPEGGSFTLCSSTGVGDGKWHHIAVQRSAWSGQMWLFVDGELEASGIGPPGDISFPTGGEVGHYQEDFLFLGASRRNPALGFQSFRGWLDEIRFSNGLRYPAGGFDAPSRLLPVDGMTAALFHLNEGRGLHIFDSALPESDEQHGSLVSIPSMGPLWQVSDLFIPYDHVQYLPFLIK